MARGDPNVWNCKTVRQDFFDAYKRLGSIRKACLATGQSSAEVQLARRCDADFARRWAETMPPSPAWRTRRRGGPKAGWQKVFLEAMFETASVTKAARAAGVTRATVYRHRTTDADFNLNFIRWRENAIDRIEGRILYQCIHGFETVSVKNGVEVRINDPRPDLVLAYLDRVAARTRRQPR